MANNRKTKSNELFKQGLRRCHKCKKIKVLSLFYNHSGRSRGYDYACKKCKDAGVREYRKNPEYRKADARRAKKYRDIHKIKLIHKRYLKTYGITYEQKESLLKEQNYQCKICSKEVNMISGHLDHNHETKKIRGILCTNCNTAIGLFKDDKEILLKAVGYLAF